MHLASLWKDERGFVNTVEMVFIATILVIGLAAGWKTVNQAVNNELEDVANAINSIDQSYKYGGVSGCCGESAGSKYRDSVKHSPVDTCTRDFDDPSVRCVDD